MILLCRFGNLIFAKTFRITRYPKGLRLGVKKTNRSEDDYDSGEYLKFERKGLVLNHSSWGARFLQAQLI